MKNTNRLKLVPALVIGLVLSAFNAMAEVKTVVAKTGTNATIEIKKGEVGKVVLWTFGTQNSGLRTYIVIIKLDIQINIDPHNMPLWFANYPNFKIAGPAKIQLTGGAGRGMLSVEITPNEKH